MACVFGVLLVVDVDVGIEFEFGYVDFICVLFDGILDGVVEFLSFFGQDSI